MGIWFNIYILINKIMSKALNSLRDRYQQIRAYAFNSEMKKVSYKDIGKYKDEAQREIERMNQTNTFDNLEEVDFYRDKFAQLETAMATASKNKLSMKDFTNQARQIFKEKGFASRNSYLSQPPIDPKVTSQPQAQNRVLQSFFDEKRSKIVPEVGFRSLLQNPPISPKNFKKRIGVNNDEISRLKAQNQELRRLAESGKLGLGEGNLEVQIRRQEERIRFLQSQNQRLSRDNTKLKSQRSVTVYSTQNYDDYLYSPYVINPRENDLMKISLRSSDMDSYSNYNPNLNGQPYGNEVHYQDDQAMMPNFPSFNSKSQSAFNIPSRNFDAMSEMGDYERNKDRYSIFDMSRSHYSDVGPNDTNFNMSNGSSGVEDSRTAARNKAAFFRNSGLIVRDSDIEIAYKRTENNNLDSNRIILYFNNKLTQPRRIMVNYEYQNQYYDLKVPQKINQIGSLKQGREVVEVKLRNNQDLNSVIEANINIDGKNYKLWLPAMFIRLERPRQGMMQQGEMTKKVVFPSKIFVNEIEAEKIMENMEIYGRGESWGWGSSPVHDGPIKLQWRQGNKLQVSTSSKWIDFLTFVMFDYR